jgi:hypothetical protein
MDKMLADTNIYKKIYENLWKFEIYKPEVGMTSKTSVGEPFCNV